MTSNEVLNTGKIFTTKNPIDLTKIKRGYSIENTTGTETVSATSYITNYIPLVVGQTFAMQNSYQKVTFYDASFAIKRTATVYATIGISTTDATEVYFRLTGLLSDIGVNQLVLDKCYLGGAAVIGAWIFDTEDVSATLLGKGIISEFAGMNLFNYKTVNPSTKYSDFIPVIGSTYYSKTQNTSVDWYDSAKTVISTGQGSSALNVLSPSNAAFVKINFTNYGGLYSTGYFCRGYAVNANDVILGYKSYQINGSVVTPLIQKNWLHIGDSISVNITTGNMNYPFSVQRNLGFKGYSNTAVSGRTMGDFATGSTYFRMSADDNIVTIALGTNDQGYNIAIGTFTGMEANSFFLAMNNLYTRIQAINPLAVIAFFTPIKRNTGVNALGLDIIDYRNAMIDYCQNKYIKYLDLYYESGLNPGDTSQSTPLFAGDTTHPNQTAHDLFLYPRVRQFVKTLF